MSKEDQELVHIAGLLHDIGKFILPDKILKANVPLDFCAAGRVLLATDCVNVPFDVFVSARNAWS